MKMMIKRVNAYTSRYVSAGSTVQIEGFTVNGYPYITSKHPNNKGHKVVINNSDCIIIEEDK